MEKTEIGTLRLSVAQWHDMGLSGKPIPMCVPVKGVSMYPLIRGNRDKVIINFAQRPPVRGDVVLFYDPRRERYVLHRLWDIAPGRVLTWGDNCPYPDGWMKAEYVWGIAASVKRGKRLIRFETNAARRTGIVLAKLRHAYCRARISAYRTASRLPSPVKGALKKIRKLIAGT